MSAEKDAQPRLSGVSKNFERHLNEEAERTTRNFLTTLRSVFHKTVENCEDLSDFAAYFEGRFAVLSQTHLLLFRRPYEGAELEELVREQLRFPTVPNDDQVEISGPAIKLTGSLAQNLALAIYELTMNAMKYGALTADNGRIKVKWRIHQEPELSRLLLTWQESGVPVMPTQPARFGFGRELIERALPYEFGADTSLDFAPGGVKCVIDIPLPKRQAG